MRSLARLLSTLLLMLLFFLIFFFALKNQHLVPLYGFAGEQRWPLAWLLLLASLIGVLATLVAIALAFWRPLRAARPGTPTS